MVERRKPGLVRDAIIDAFKTSKREMSVAEVREAVKKSIGGDVPASSVRSYLNINTPGLFIRGDRGHYRMVRR